MSKFFYHKLYFVPIVVLLIDRFLKFLARSTSADPGTELIPGIVDFKFFANEGIAFSLPVSGPLLWILSGMIIVFFSGWAWSGIKKRHVRTTFSYVFFILGAVSNLVDRITYGYTTDYLIFFDRSAVNLADAMILLGALMLISTKNNAQKDV